MSHIVFAEMKWITLNRVNKRIGRDSTIQQGEAVSDVHRSRTDVEEMLYKDTHCTLSYKFVCERCVCMFGEYVSVSVCACFILY